MDFPSVNGAVPLSLIAFLAVLVYTLQKIARQARKSHKEDSAAILQLAKDEDSLLKAKLEARIERLDAQLQTLELSVTKDVSHLKETYSNEIKNLGKKIEDLRDEVRSTHSQLVQLLTKLIDTKD